MRVLIDSFSLSFFFQSLPPTKQKALTPAGASQIQNVRAILLDTKGPEIRTGKLQGDVSGHETITLPKGQSITLKTDAATREAGSTVNNLYVDYPTLHKALQVGSKVLLDDGAVVLTVTSIDSDTAAVHCHIDNTGDLRSRAGVNLPLADTSDLPAMSQKDQDDILYGMRVADIDYVAASFVQTAQHVRDIRAHIEQCAKQLNWDQPLPLIISKIETAGALVHFDEILRESDGIMVARGDLGVEIPLAQVTNAQKEMVAACNAAGKPVIVATQMLESMSKNPRPTRAEVSDVTNAVYDGCDAVMLSGETAKGKYPTETVEMMNHIIRSAERYAQTGALRERLQSFVPTLSNDSPDVAIAKAAVTAVKERKCAAVVVTSNSNLPALVASFRPAVPVLSFTPSYKLGRQWQIHRGIHPIVFDGKPEEAVEEAKRLGYLSANDEVVIVSLKEENTMGHTAGMKIATVP